MLHVLSSAALLALLLAAAHSHQQQSDEPPAFPLISDSPFLDTNQFNPSGERVFFFRSANNPSAVSPRYEIRPPVLRAVCIIYSVVCAALANWPLKQTECCFHNRTAI
jgi:hypothetical protein